MKKTITHLYSGKSLKELREEFGTGSSGFYNQDWYKKESLYTEKAKAGTYEIVVEKQLENLTYEEQKKKLKKGWNIPHPAVLAEAILMHYKKTGERLLKDWYSRTRSTDSDGYRVSVGYFDSGGLSVGSGWGGSRFDHVGVSASRKLKNLTPHSLESFDPLSIKVTVAGGRNTD